tara:strand:- start:1614 stop:2174 length:561 start_codon:yes stop_codon:yes gene_type:complete
MVMIFRKRKTKTVVAQKAATPEAPSGGGGGGDGIFGMSFTRGENEVLDFLDNVENRSSDTLRSVLCTIVSDERLSKLVVGKNQKMACKDVTARLDKITEMVKVKVQNAKFKSEAVRGLAIIFSEEMVSVYQKIKARLCTSGDTIIETATIMAMIKDAREKFCKNTKTVELKPIFEDVTRIRGGKFA